MAKNQLTNIFIGVVILVTIFIMVMIAITGQSNNDKYDNTNLTDTQDAQSEQKAEVDTMQKPIFTLLTTLVPYAAIALIFFALLAYILKTYFGRRG